LGRIGIKLLGIDVGTSGTRAVVIERTGKVVASASGPHQPFTSPKPGWAEQDPNDWWSACGEAVRRVTKQAGAPNLHRSALMQQNYLVYRSLYPALRDLFRTSASACPVAAPERA
jgi:FGGY family of carbohydrate kinases, N-terminal domain